MDLVHTLPLVLVPLVLASTMAAATGAQAAPPTRKPGELFVDLGFGNAVCGNKKPDSNCPVDGALALGIGGAWRLHPNWSVGGELGLWSFKVRDSWRGQLSSEASDVKLSSLLLSPFARWHWIPKGVADPYVQLGVGFGAVTGKASNAGGTYQAQATGITFPIAIGVEWYLGKNFRIGPQALAYLQYTTRVCETSNGDKTCHRGTADSNALPWRIVALGTFVFGGP